MNYFRTLVFREHYAHDQRRGSCVREMKHICACGSKIPSAAVFIKVGDTHFLLKEIKVFKLIIVWYFIYQRKLKEMKYEVDLNSASTK